MFFDVLNDLNDLKDLKDLNYLNNLNDLNDLNDFNNLNDINDLSWFPFVGAYLRSFSGYFFFTCASPFTGKNSIFKIGNVIILDQLIVAIFTLFGPVWKVYSHFSSALISIYFAIAPELGEFDINSDNFPRVLNHTQHNSFFLFSPKPKSVPTN